MSQGESGDAALMRCLADMRIVEPAGVSSLAACDGLPSPVSSFLDDTLPPARALLPALARLAVASSSLRWRGFHAVISRLRARKTRKFGSSRPAQSARSHGDALRVAAAFEACDNLIGSKDRCLPRSLAACHRMLDLGLAAHLVVGVRLNPFHAHAWVQWGDCLVNERVDATRPFTPILVV
jgi:hypothetical protein